ncbi:MAG: hypothetical protein LBQ87_08405 [Candidatus Fibromonas sp.]|nr:hypothetical protein [Candidatus Fibromonas sp.]
MIKIDTIYKDIINGNPCTGKRVSYDIVKNKEPIIAKVCEYEGGKVRVDTIIYVNKEIRTTKFIKTDSTSEFIAMTSDIKGNLLEFKHEIRKDHDLIRIIHDNDTADIVQKTPCDFAVIESSGDTVSFHLDPKRKFSDFINKASVLVQSKISPEHKNIIDTSSMYLEIINENYSGCNRYYEMLEMQKEGGKK